MPLKMVLIIFHSPVKLFFTKVTIVDIILLKNDHIPFHIVEIILQMVCVIVLIVLLMVVKLLRTKPTIQVITVENRLLIPVHIDLKRPAKPLMNNMPPLIIRPKNDTWIKFQTN